MKHKTSIRSPLAKVKGLGSAHDGTGHFIAQRVTAIALIPLTLWFVCAIIGLAVNGDQADVEKWMGSGLHASALIIMLGATFYHAKIGVQVVIEDYIHGSCYKIGAMLANVFFMYGMAIISIVAVLKLHFHA